MSCEQIRPKLTANFQQSTDFGYDFLKSPRRRVRVRVQWRLIKNKVLKGRQFPGRRWSAKHGTPAKKIIKTIRVPKVRQKISRKKKYQQTTFIELFFTFANGLGQLFPRHIEK